MKVLIFGAGGVGSVIGAFLARTGHDVSLLGRAWHLDAIEKSGLGITGIWGDYRLKAFDLYRDYQSIPDQKEFDLIVLTVKSYDTEKSASALATLLKNKTMILALQNGLGNIETILKHIPAEQLLIGRVIFGVECTPGLVRVTVNADSVRVGALSGVVPIVSAEKMANLLASAKIPALPVKDILPFIWAKVIYNCALNAICSLHEIPYGGILKDGQTLQQMQNVVRECYQVGLAHGVALDPADPDEFLEQLTTVLIPRTAEHFPSMLQDLRKGKKTDIDALNAEIVRLARVHGLSSPTNQLLTEQIRHKESLARRLN